MSLVVAISGQYKEYELPKSKIRRKIRKSSNLDNENDFVLSEEIDREEEFLNSKNKKSSLGLKQYKSTKENFKVKRQNIFANHIMSAPVHSIEKSMKANEALQLMDKYNYRHFPVVEEGKIVGIVSDRDLLKYSSSPRFNEMKLEDIITNEVIVAKEETEIKVIARIMVYEGIGALPIVNESYEVVGIVTKTDILKCVMDNMRFDVLV